MVTASDAMVFPAPRAAFCGVLIGSPGHVGRALVRDRRLAAWGVVRPCRKGCKVGPLIAEDRGSAEAVLAALVASAGSSEIFLDVPSVNRDAIALAQDLGLEPVFETARMYKGVIPALRLERVFGVTTFELGFPDDRRGCKGAVIEVHDGAILQPHQPVGEHTADARATLTVVAHWPRSATVLALARRWSSQAVQPCGKIRSTGTQSASAIALNVLVEPVLPVRSIWDSHARGNAGKSCEIAATQATPLPYRANRILTVGDCLRYCRRQARRQRLLPSHCLERVGCRQRQNAILRFREDHQAFSAAGMIQILQIEFHGAPQPPLIRPSPTRENQ